MKNNLILIILIATAVSLKAQNFKKHNLDANFIVENQVAADFDNDGDVDVFGFQYYYLQKGKISHLTNNCEIEPLKFTYKSYGFAEVNKLLGSGDFNGDGFIDVLISLNFNNPSMWLFQNDGNGSFVEKELGIANVEYIDTFDYDNDHDIDLLVKDKGPNFRILTNDGKGAFSIVKSFTLTGVDSKFLFDDFDNDGKRDIVLGENDSFDSKIDVFFNKGNYLFEQITLETGADHVNQLQAGDFDLDGKIDIMYVEDRYFHLLKNLGNRQFKSNKLYKSNSVAGYYSSFAITDIDYDGDIDIFLCDYSKEGLIFYQNDGTSEYSTYPKTILCEASCEDIIISDFTCDGKKDIFINYISNILLENNFPVNTISQEIENINVYPNPMVDQIEISLPVESGIVSILDVNGKVVFSQRLSDLENSIIDVNNLNQGVYIINIMTESNKVYIKKFVKN